ncbi:MULTISPECIES: hypothetical protein [unclassified Spirosoma]|uniref:hypothetical protein n=1 Tax=unclassified Spirosoma TaxID=2621999 RepID=UPI000963AA4C|nr:MULTISPECIES: hypothetical protein [unclassified Spirosoma]MBN8823708.1 hypothetical protein [Spirosoma sp.]OJW76745.1 MAG: hypothetical protein BGO59_21130 [Spirosoma sp. 48-14]
MKPLYLSRYRYLVAVGLLSGFLGSCSPTIPVYQLEPVSGDVARIEGRQVTKVEQNGVSVVASFEKEDLEYVALDIELKNHTDHPIDINPADFHFKALNSVNDTLTDPLNPNLILYRSAADPSYEAGRMGLKRKEETKRLKRAKVINTLLMVAVIAADASSASNSRSYNEYIRNRTLSNLAYQSLAVKRVVNYSNFATRMQRYDYEEYRWRELALKAGTLPAGESVRGLVYLPKVPNATYLAINYTVPEQSTVPLLFKQELVQQKKLPRRR